MTHHCHKEVEKARLEGIRQALDEVEKMSTVTTKPDATGIMSPETHDVPAKKQSIIGGNSK